MISALLSPLFMGNWCEATKVFSYIDDTHTFVEIADLQGFSWRHLAEGGVGLWPRTPSWRGPPCAAMRNDGRWWRSVGRSRWLLGPEKRTPNPVTGRG
jgi:hypothetical protein